MSNLTVDTLTNQDVQLAKAWVHLNGTGVISIYSSFGVDSITDSSTGKYVANLTTSQLDTGFCRHFSCNSGFLASEDDTVLSVSTVGVRVTNPSTGASTDNNRVSISILSN